MKKIISLILSVMLFVTCFSPVSSVDVLADKKPTTTEKTKDNPAAEGFSAVVQNDKYVLYYRESDANLAVLNKTTGYAFYSNPKTIDENSTGTKIKSQLVFKYYKNNAVTVMDNYDFGIEDQNLPEFTVENDILKVLYKVGDSAFTTDMIPAAFVKESFEKNILSKLSEEDKATVLERYVLYTTKGMDEEILKEIEMNFPSVRKHDLYVFNTATPSYIAEKIYNIFVSVGYSVKDLDRYCSESEVENRYEEKPFFNAQVAYSLSDTGLKVEIDPSKIEYNDTFKPISLEILPYFGACFKGSDGYMLVPDGSGAVIEFDNGKTGVNYYEKAVYEVDNVYNEATSTGNIQLTSLPFFGISGEKGGIIASVDSGYEGMSVAAEISGSNTSFNRIAPSFTLFSSDKFSFSANSLDTYLKYSEKIFSGKITVNYLFTDNYASYSELAVIYREHLKKLGVLKSNSKAKNNMNISFIGTSEVTKSFLGIPYKSMEAYTTVEQAGEILDKLSIKNTDVRLTDFLNGGSSQNSVTSLKLQSSVGKLKEIKALYGKSSNTYLSMFAQYEADADKSDSAISISQEVAYRLNYDLINRNKETQKYTCLLTSALLEKFSGKIASQLEDDGIKAINLRDLGYELNSDFREDSEQDRYQARVAAQKYMQNLSKKATLSVDKGSIFALPYVNKIWDIPMDSSNYHIEDYSVPFYQMVISGSIAYTAEPINDGSQINYEFLKCLEYGAEPQFALTYEDLDNVVYYKEDYYGYNYENHIDTIKNMAKRYSKVADSVGNSTIVRHENFDGKTAVTEYDNGVKLYVNYTKESMKSEGNIVPAEDFVIIK